MKYKIIDDNFINRLETLGLYLQSPMRGYFGGNHKTNVYGQTVEFADFREYTFGDDIRRIDWNLYARFEKHYLKLFVDERQMHIQIFLDCSASMEKGNYEKAVYALRAVAALGFLSVQNMDKTSFKLIKGGYAEDLCGIVTGKEAFYRGISKLEEVEFGGETDLKAAITNSPNPGYNDGLTVIISDFLTDSDWRKAVDYLLYRHRQVMLIQVLSPEELNPFYNGRMFLKDSEAEDVMDDRNMKMKITRANMKAYQAALKDFLADIKSFCSSRGVSFFSVSSDEAVEKLLFGRLMEAGTVR